MDARERTNRYMGRFVSGRVVQNELNVTQDQPWGVRKRMCDELRRDGFEDRNGNGLS